MPHTGTLRGDLLAYLDAANEQRAGLLATFSGMLAGHDERPAAPTPGPGRR